MGAYRYTTISVQHGEDVRDYQARYVILRESWGSSTKVGVEAVGLRRLDVMGEGMGEFRPPHMHGEDDAAVADIVEEQVL